MRLPSLKGRRLVSALLFAGAALVAGAVIGACTSDEDQQQAQAVEQQTQQQDQDQPAAQVSGEPRGNTLQLIMDRGMLKCGVKQTQPLFGNRDEDGNVTGFDIEFCKAIAAAVLKDADAVEYIDASDASTRFELLADGQIDILIRTTTITSSRDMELDVDFAQTTFYTGQGFAVRKDSGINSTSDMANAAICVQTGTTTEQNVADHFTDIG
ncbi:MAG: transporter substrate-binding domain-containing protein, partial [Chloroflexi bacterium]|nr:transporter substrate-binding domain-containing protein [Chloroflexota bacterium]